MPLNDAQLLTDLKNMFGHNAQTDAQAKAKIAAFCLQLQGAIKSYVASGTVTIATGTIAVTTSGTAVAQTGVNSSPAIGTIS